MNLFRTRLPVLSLALLALGPMAGGAQPTGASKTSSKPAIVLVHGAFADGSSWAKVIPLLERDGYAVTSVQNSLTSFADDVATTKRVIDAQKGNVIAVGHSYGGAVISGAAAGNPNVKALVYVAAFGPEAGEKFGEMLEKRGHSDLGPSLRPDAAGFVYIDRAKFHDVFAKDLSLQEARVMAATQRPINGAIFGASVDNPAWKTIPSWYLVATEDRSITPELERFMAKRMNARTKEIKSSHVPMLSHPGEVSKWIDTAAKATAN